MEGGLRLADGPGIREAAATRGPGTVRSRWRSTATPASIPMTMTTTSSSTSVKPAVFLMPKHSSTRPE